MTTILAGRPGGVSRHPSGITRRSRADRRLSSPILAYPRGMEALAERLSQLDSQAEGAIRVVMFYDTLMRRRVDLPALARASAGLAECVVGIRLHGTGRVVRTSPDGRAVTEPPPPPSSTAPVTLDEEEIGAVWLERAGPPGALDEMVLDRLAIAAAAVVERYGPATATMADPALVELVISADTDEAARARALRLLGFPADLPVRVVAVRSPVPLDRLGALVCAGRPVKAAPLADVGVLLVAALDPTRFPTGVRAGIGSAGCPPDRSWAEARTALRFATDREPVVHHDGLGALALLARVPREVARANADVAAVGRLDPDDLRTLDTYCATGSLRRAAEQLHLHHSSVSRRLDQIGRCLGVDLTTPAGLTRAGLAITMWRLSAD
jgi:hypothetical protein